MSGGHVLEQLTDSSTERYISELLVHVDNTSLGGVLQHDAIVLHGIGSLLEDFRAADDLTGNSLNLPLRLQVVPKSRFGKSSV